MKDAEKYSEKMNKDIFRIFSYALNLLHQYSCSGNVRELENLVERSVALSSTNIILPESLTIFTHKRRRWIEGIKVRRFDMEGVDKGVD